MFGYTEDESVVHNINDLIVLPELVGEGEALTTRVAAGEKLRVEALRRHRDGHTLWVAIAATPFGVADQPGRVYAMYHDISAQKRAEEDLKTLLLVDELTGLPNRRAFITLSEQALKLAMRMERDVLMIFIDVDHLKYINDTYGHLAGDRALIDTARVLRESCREADIIARLGGDEFVAPMTGIAHPPLSPVPAPPALLPRRSRRSVSSRRRTCTRRSEVLPWCRHRRRKPRRELSPD